jgi:hypothetical protein
MAHIEDKSCYFKYLRPHRDGALYHYFVSVQLRFQHYLLNPTMLYLGRIRAQRRVPAKDSVPSMQLLEALVVY